VSILSRFVDERFLMHRLRSTSTAGIAVAVISILVFMYRLYVEHVYSWDLFAVGAAFAVIKMSLMAWYVFTD
jgi:hypothetical protein